MTQAAPPQVPAGPTPQRATADAYQPRTPRQWATLAVGVLVLVALCLVAGRWQWNRYVSRDAEIERTVREARVHRREQRLERREDPDDEGVQRRAWRQPPDDVLDGGERAVEHRGARLRRAHAHRVPVVEHLDPGVARHERVHEARGVARLGVEPQHAEPRPRGRVRREDLAAVERVPAPLVRAGLGARAEQHEVVAALGVPEPEDAPADGVLEQPVERRVAAQVEVARDARPHVVHVHGERRRGGGTREPRLLVRDLAQGEARAAERLRHERAQVPGLGERREVLGEERVVAVVARGPAADLLQQLVGEQRARRGERGG